MKQNCKWIAALFTAASATVASAWCGSGGCGYTTSYQLAPVGERVIYYNNYSSPSPGEALGNVIAAPFRLVGGALSWTGQAISGQPALEPVGERVTIIRHRTVLEPVGERFVTTSCNTCMPRFTTLHVMRQAPILRPVGERFVTTRVIRYQLAPVGERFTTVKIIRHGPMLKPVGEKCTLIRHHGKKVMLKKVTYQYKMLKPVGERTIIRTHKVFLKPVGERVWTFSRPSCGCM